MLPCALLLLLFLAALVPAAIFLPRVLAPIAALERFFSLTVAVFTANKPLPAENKARRLLLLLALPWLGGIFCLCLKAHTPMPERSTSRFFDDDVANAVSAISHRGSCFCESAEYFPDGRNMFERLLLDLKGAKKEILLDYYILARGKFFDSVLAILERKTQDGLQINIVYDDFGCAASLPKNFAKTLRAKGISATIFHPLKAFPIGKLNRRDHRKIAVIDRKIAYTGGINLADEYIGEKIRFGHWKDSAVRLTGVAAERFADLFFEKESADSALGSGFPCVVFGDRADRSTRVGEEIFFKLISCAAERIFITTPYLAPSEKISAALRSAARAGIDVRLFIPHIPDKKAVFALTRSFARELSAYGVKVREYTAGFLHAKSLVCDGKYAVVGSYNLDERSLHMQAECGVFLRNETLAFDIERDFIACWETGSPVPKATFKEKLTAFFLRLFLPLI